MHRFYCEHADFKQPHLSITDRDEIHHIRDVLRLQAGDELYLFNGRNEQARVSITRVKDTAINVAVKEVQAGAEGAQGIKIILACAVPKRAKFEFIIEKCTELGVDEIIPLRTRRTEVVFTAEKMDGKQARFQKVAVNAAKQCGRVSVPRIHAMMGLSDALKSKGAGVTALIPSLNGATLPVGEVLKGHPAPAQVMVLIGPEGDFTPEEVRLAVDQGCIPVSLGATVLKVDTAAIAAVSLIRFLYRP